MQRQDEQAEKNAIHLQDAVEENPIGLAKDTAAKICQEIDDHVSTLFTQFHQYYKHYWLASGPQYRELHAFMKECFSQVRRDMDRLGERLVTLGGSPTCRPDKQVEKAFIRHENEGIYRIRDMLLLDAENENKICSRLRKTIQISFQLSDWGTQHILQKALVHAEGRAHKLDYFLIRDSPIFGIS